MGQPQLLVCVCFVPALAQAATKLLQIAYHASHRQPSIICSLSAAPPLVLILVQPVITPTFRPFLAYNAPLAAMTAVIPPTATAAVLHISTTMAYATIPALLPHSRKQPLIVQIAMNTALVAQFWLTTARHVKPTEHTEPIFSAMSASPSALLLIMPTGAPRHARPATLPASPATEGLLATATSATSPTSSVETPAP